MGQQDIVGFLEKNKGKWFTTTEIAEHFKRPRSNMALSMIKLRRYNLVKYKPSVQCGRKVIFYKR